LPAGTFIVFEGIDGAGKSTQIQLLKAHLEARGFPVAISREPTGGPWGRKLRQSAATGRLSPQEELQTFILDRTEHVETLIAPSLAAGKIVILDRYYYSTIAYQGVRGMDPAALQLEMESRFPRPDRMFLLDLDPAESLHRIATLRGSQPDEFEKRDALERIREVFLSLNGPEIAVIDANRPPEAIHRSVLAALPASLTALSITKPAGV
jgi:dTMP kinase